MRQFLRKRPGKRRRENGGYSLIETMITVLIIHMISGMVIVSVSSIQRSEKLSRAGQQVVVALRYARILAMSTGQPAGVEFNTTTNQVRVFQGASATTVNNSMIQSGTYVINFNTQADVNGVTISNALLSSDVTNPYWVVFGTLGGTVNNGSVALNYGGQSVTVQIPLVGDAKVQ
jgi:Tfp pilus assembly protein FimT